MLVHIRSIWQAKVHRYMLQQSWGSTNEHYYDEESCLFKFPFATKDNLLRSCSAGLF